jgi:nucleoside-diphosphate-sugar epimerase
MRRTALIAGTTGVVGRALLEHLEGQADWDIVALSRRPPDFPTRARFLSVDLANRDDTVSKLAGVKGITHAFFAAYSPAATLGEEARLNATLFENFLAAVEDSSQETLAHVQLVHGSKWYGSHLGPYRTPAREDDPPHLPPNFYIDQQSHVIARQRGKGWTWSILRPHGICGLAIGSSLSQLTAMAVYASIAKHLGQPLRFPGKPGAFTAVYQMTEAAYLARGMLWTATSAQCRNQIYNFTNGDFLRWVNLWPHLARFLEMEPGPVQTIPFRTFIADKEDLWQEIRRKHVLADHRLEQLVNCTFADFVFSAEYDQMSDMTKIRNAGWVGANDSQAMYLRLLGELRERRIIP